MEMYNTNWMLVDNINDFTTTLIKANKNIFTRVLGKIYRRLINYQRTASSQPFRDRKNINTNVYKYLIFNEIFVPCTSVYRNCDK